MSKMTKILLMLSVLWTAGVGFADETHADGVIAEVLGRVGRVKAAQPDAVPMAFWDFDGTIIWGDLTLGSKKSPPYFTGLMESAVLAGLTTVYSGEDGWRRYFYDDRLRLRELAQWMAVPFRAQMYGGRSVAEVESFAAERFASDLSRYYFRSSIRIMKALRDAGVENHVLSGSPDFFVRAAAQSLGIPSTNIHGVRVAEKNGKLTTQVIYPLPLESEKIAVMDDILKSRPHSVAVAGFGNDYRMDGPFLKWIVGQRLPGGGNGFALMINGKNHDAVYDGLFRCVDQTELVGFEADGKPSER